MNTIYRFGVYPALLLHPRAAVALAEVQAATRLHAEALLRAGAVGMKYLDQFFK